MKKNKKVALIVSLSAVGSIVLGGVLGGYFYVFHHYHGKEIIDNWSEDQEFDISRVKSVNKEPGKEFKILNFADIQIRDFNKPIVKKTVHKEMDYLVETYKPDMITLTGDQVMCNYNHDCLKKIIRWLDSYKVPWAPIFGNHDSGDELDSATCDTLKMCELYEKGKYSLFSRGPSNLGTYGNYVVNIKENDKVIRSLYFIDSGVATKISDNQVNWVKWNADGMKNTLGEYPESSVYTHLPLPEHALAYRTWAKSPDDRKVYTYHALRGSEQNGFFEMTKGRNFKNFLCGHQHGTNFTLPYEGADFTFTVKTSQTLSYYEGDDVYLNGCTIVTVGEETKISHHYVDRGTYNIPGMENIVWYYK